ncbi:MAG TPA: TIM barrel protein [Phycisphaerae bacterium]|nr:TIM barrel protein [Phycisphaerae bacterium]HOM51354.1 TIM barrel protein [Phycisphaerae bacterium]HON65888.1 TIM barrel protein [Phycisphaerae bacterium]HOQ85015.1 TIM barrel protein [Phycisphaerae bacterium]HPP26683.1 TIM barrel protein [Phycisphaerae bacterium]
MARAKVKASGKGRKYRFSFGPWNIHEGADPFGPPVRQPIAFAKKLKKYRELGFEGIQFHDDDAVPDIDSKSPQQVRKEAARLGKLLANEGLVPEFVAPRLWESPKTIDGGFTSNNPAERKYAFQRSLQAVDIAAELGSKNIVLWLAREGTYIRESKNARLANGYILDAINAMLEHNPEIRVMIEPKPNEPMDHAYVPTIGHAISLAYLSVDPNRVGGLIETAHAKLAGLDPSDEMAFALFHKKLWSVHLNDQNGLKFDEDKSFGAANLREAFNQVRVLEEGGFGLNGEFVGLDVKVMRTQKANNATAHLSNSKRFFELMVHKVRTFNRKAEAECIKNRDYEALERLVVEHLLGV